MNKDRKSFAFGRNCFSYFLLILCLGLCQNGCTGKKEPEERFTIGFSQCVGTDLWRKTMLDEMKTELSFHPEATFIYAEAENDSRKQIEQVRKMLDDGIDLLIISPNEARPLTPVVEEAFNKGIPVIVIDRKTSSKLYTAYVGADNYTIGKRAGEYIAGLLSGKGNVMEIMGLAGSSPAIERQQGFNDALKDFPNISVKKQLYGNWLKEQATAAVEKADMSEIDAVFAHNDMMASGAYTALEAKGLQNKVKIVGVDGLPGVNAGLQFVSDRMLHATLLYPTGGKEAIRTAFQILNKEPFEKENLLHTVVIDSSNVHLMKMQADKLHRQQNDIERQQVILREQREIYNNQRTILNILIISLVLAIVFGGIAFYSLTENWKNNKQLELKNEEIIAQKNRVVEISEKAKAATEVKFNFFTNISHEFRTPLTLILLPLEELVSNPNTSQKEKPHLQIIQKNVFRLLRLVNQLIDFRKIEVDKMTIKASENDLVKFCKDIFESFRAIADKRKIDFRMSSAEKTLSVWYDRHILDKVIFNLLSNAFKFVKDGGRIYLHLERDRLTNSAVLTVEDDGAGMSEETVKYAFDSFYQGQDDKAGSGLGLALSKEIIALHRGSISVQSTKWKGTCFRISLPLGNAHLKAEEKVDEEFESDLNFDELKNYLGDLENELRRTIEDESFEIVKEQSLLIIEDNEDMRMFLEEKLSSEFEVFTAPNGEAGLTEAFEKVPDLIISDVVLPLKTGLEITHILKSDIRTSHIPIILLTARGSLEQQIEGIKNKADSYIVKPFSMHFLTEKIKNLLENRSLLREHYSSEFQPDRKNISSTLDKKFINDFSGIVENNLANENLSVEDICKSIGVSRVQLYRKVKALLGCSITDYILNRRLKKAKYLLLRQDFTISEIAYQVGFSSPTYFATVFKSKYGCTPSEFKKKKLTV